MFSRGRPLDTQKKNTHLKKSVDFKINFFFDVAIKNNNESSRFPQMNAILVFGQSIAKNLLIFKIGHKAQFCSAWIT